MCASRRRTKWILGNVQNDYCNMTDHVNCEVESSTPSDQQQRRPDGQKFDDDVAQKEGDGWLSEDAVDCHCLRMICGIPSNTEELCSAYIDELSCTCYVTSVQWRSVCNTRNRPRSNVFILLTSRAAALSTRSSLCVTYFDAPGWNCYPCGNLHSNHVLVFNDRCTCYLPSHHHLTKCQLYALELLHSQLIIACEIMLRSLALNFQFVSSEVLFDKTHASCWLLLLTIIACSYCRTWMMW